MHQTLPTPLLLKEQAPPAADQIIENQQNQDQIIEGSGNGLLCAACQTLVCRPASRISILGAHQHVRANPAGVVYQIGCFSVAEGCVTVGVEECFWSWFTGYSWQIENCGKCGNHLGWLFRSAAKSFHGLILDNLIEEQGLERGSKA